MLNKVDTTIQETLSQIKKEEEKCQKKKILKY
jgi:hypothetical protein